MNTMKPFRFLLLPFAIALLCVACGPRQQPSTNESGVPTEIKPEFPIHIQLSESTDYKNTLPFTLADIAEDIRYIPLETKPESFIGTESLPSFSKDFIFIVSRGILLQFDQQGKFIRRINRQGKGPGECSVWQYGIDEKNRLIYIFDNSYNDVNTFTFNGEYVKTIRNPFSEEPSNGFPSGFIFDKMKGNLIFNGFQSGSGNEPYKYAVTDTAGTILYKCPNYTQFPVKVSGYYSSSGGNGGYIYKFGSSYYYHYIYNDTIFVINEDYTCSPAYIRHLPNRTTIEDRMQVMARVKKHTDLYGKNSYSKCLEDRRYLYLYHSQTLDREKGISLLSLYEKATGTLIENINPDIPLLNNWDGGMDVPLYDFFPGENQFCMMLDPYKMKETLTEEHFASRSISHPEKAEALKKLVSTLKEDDNPVLMIITTK